jgi:ZIP family zinc transporter
MAVGIVFAGWLSGNVAITLSGAFALAIGIAIQNFPEGAVVSLPLRAEGASRKKAFALGALSGAVEPVGALITLLAAEALSPFMPYLLSLAAGAMIYVVIEEMLPEVSEGEHFDAGTILFAVGFTLMMVLDSAL